MKVSKTAKIWINYHNTHSKKNTVRSYQAIIEQFCQKFGDTTIDQVTPEDILTFLNRLTDGNKPYTKRIRYAQLSSFFNFVRDNINPDSGNPCDTPMIRKLYRERVTSRWEIIEKETVDEIIFRTTKIRNRLMLELIARGGMRVGEVLKLRSHDLRRHSATIIFHDQNSFRSVKIDHRGAFAFLWLRIPLHLGKIDLKCRSLARFAVH